MCIRDSPDDNFSVTPVALAISSAGQGYIVDTDDDLREISIQFGTIGDSIDDLTSSYSVGGMVQYGDIFYACTTHNPSKLITIDPDDGDVTFLAYLSGLGSGCGSLFYGSNPGPTPTPTPTQTGTATHTPTNTLSLIHISEHTRPY